MTTQKAYFSYEEVIDLHTESDRVSVIGIHTPTGDTPRKLCPGFFAQFKKYKYLGCKVALVPAATLPADPLSVSYESAEPSIDPRDMLNPILFRGCHGNDLGNILNRIYSSGSVQGSDLSQLLHSDSTDLWNLFNNPDQDDTLTGTNLLESLYYRALTDKTWKKANVQRGFRIAGLRPRVYSLATNMYLQNATALGTSNVAPAPFSGDFGEGEFIDEWKPFSDETANPVRYFTPRTVPLGWLDTRAVVGYTPDDRTAVPDVGLDPVLKSIVGSGTVDVTLPKIFMGLIMLPPAYKTEMYFRMVINHYFAFAGFRGVSMSNDMLENPNVFDWNDALVDGDSDDSEPEPEPDPDPEPEPTDNHTLVLRVLSGSLFRGAVFNPDTTSSSTTANAVVKTAYWSDGDTGWSSKNGSNPYGYPIFQYFNSGDDLSVTIHWNGTAFVDGDGATVLPADVITAVKNYCDISNMTDDLILSLFKVDVTDVNAS